MPSITDHRTRVAVLADSDTRWKWGALTARRLIPGGGLDGFLLRGRATPTARQLDEVGIRADSLSEVTGVEFLHTVGRAPYEITENTENTAATDAARGTGHGEHHEYGRNREHGENREPYDVVVLACVGGTVQAMLHGLARTWAGRASRPVVVTGYVGVVYEKLADGLLLRHGADLVLANSRHDADRFRAVYEGVGAGTDGVVETALPFLGGAPYDDAARGDRPYTVVFATQPSVPESRADRTYLLRRAVEHARRHPEREVLVKLRSRPGEQTTHIEELPYQKLAASLPGGRPANCDLVHGHMGEVLDRTDLLVTVSSTAALEALHRGIPTAVLTDLGVREVLGNHHFLGSGCLASWDRLDAGFTPEPDPLWLSRQGVAADPPYETAFDAARGRLAELLAAEALPPIRPFYTPTTAPGYLPGILARHQLDPAGDPLRGASTVAARAGGVRRVARGAMRNAARGAYRHGVQRVAPVIRRMGEL